MHCSCAQPFSPASSCLSASMSCLNKPPENQRGARCIVYVHSHLARTFTDWMPAPLSPGITAATLNVSKSLQSRFIYSNRLTLEHSQVQYIREQGFINISNGILSSFECHGNTEAAPLPSDTHLRACMLANSYSHSHTHTHTHTRTHTQSHTQTW